MSHYQFNKSKLAFLAAASLAGVAVATWAFQSSVGAVAVTACGDMGTVTVDSVCSMAPGEAVQYTARGGNGGKSDTDADGGWGAEIQGTFANTTASTMTISVRVGANGADGNSFGGGGGGFTALQIGDGWEIENAIVIAGGGGGGGTYSDPGGDGGSDASNPSGGGNGGDECCDGGYEGGSGSSGGGGGVGSPDPDNAGGAGGDVGVAGEDTVRLDDATGNGGDGGDGYMDGGVGGVAEDWGGGGGAGYAGGGGGGGYDSDEGGAGGGGSSYFTGDADGVNPTTLSGPQVVFVRLADVPHATTTTTLAITTTTSAELANTGAGDTQRPFVLALMSFGLGLLVFASRRRVVH